MKSKYKTLVLFLFSVIVFQCASAQQNEFADAANQYKIISAGPQYKASAFHQWLWGKNYRKEWSTPVELPVILLDTLKGGLTPFEKGGGHQTKSLRLKTKAGKQYVLRSVNKTLGKVLPENFQHTFIEEVVNDEVSMSHPYAAVSIPLMAQSANIYHTEPRYVFLPNQQALDSFNKEYDNKPYLFEQRVEGDWTNADNLGNFKIFIETDTLLQSMLAENDLQINQHAFVRARLFDMFIGDWDRHEEQWKWGMAEAENKKIFHPVPQDRDQAYFTHKNVLLNFFSICFKLALYAKFC